MELHRVAEMAIRGGNFETIGQEYADTHKAAWAAGDKVGDLDNLTVKKSATTYSLWDDAEFIAALRVRPAGDAFAIDDIWVEPRRRGQKLLIKLLLFLKTRENMQRLVLADVHSDNMIALLRANGLKLFKKYWVNDKGEVKEFSPETLDDFYGAGRWKLVLENTSDFSEWPRFNGEGYVQQSYDVLLNVFNLNEEY